MPAAARHIEIAPHCSLSMRGAWLFFGSMCFATFGLAGVVTALGFWPVLPFAGAEMALLGWALKSNMDRRFDREAISVSEHEVVIERARRTPARIVFPRHWARVKIRRADSPFHRGQLVIESHGRIHEVGRFLTEDERQHLLAELRQLIGGTNQSPVLPRSASQNQFSRGHR